MPKKFILGSGLVARLTKFMYPEYTFIPFKRSRYFSFDYVYSNNYITYDKRSDDVLSKIIGEQAKIFYKTAYSFHGMLLTDNKAVKSAYLSKIYEQYVPDVADHLKNDVFTIYNMSAQALHDKLFESQGHDIVQNNSKLISIDVNNHVLHTNQGAIEYDSVISTIPLDALYNLCNITHQLLSKPICFYTISSEKIDLEGYQQTFIADSNIDFFKCQKVGKNLYQFWSFGVIDNPAKYFGLLIGHNFEMFDSRYIEGAFPYGPAVDFSFLEKNGIHCVGSNARWDDFIGITTSVIQLKKINLA